MSFRIPGSNERLSDSAGPGIGVISPILPNRDMEIAESTREIPFHPVISADSERMKPSFDIEMFHTFRPHHFFRRRVPLLALRESACAY